MKAVLRRRDGESRIGTVPDSEDARGEIFVPAEITVPADRNDPARRYRFLGLIPVGTRMVAEYEEIPAAETRPLIRLLKSG